jgi:hypothetical protein
MAFTVAMANPVRVDAARIVLHLSMNGVHSQQLLLPWRIQPLSRSSLIDITENPLGTLQRAFSSSLRILS